MKMYKIGTKIAFFLITVIFPVMAICNIQDISDQKNGFSEPEKISLNGIWQFEQTLQAIPPATFTRTIPVPGLIHLAIPKAADYDKFFKAPNLNLLEEQHSPMDIDYQPKYSWYKREVFIPENLKDLKAILCINKSQFVTQVFVNGMDAGYSSECYTPIEFPVSYFLKYGQKNEILIRVGERVWLPAHAAGSTDLEKKHYLPGIWDDVLLSFSGNQRIHRTLILPDAKNGKVTAKILIRSLYPSQQVHFAPDDDTCSIKVEIFRNDNDEKVAGSSISGIARRDCITRFETVLTVKNPQLWSPESPFLYLARFTVFDKGKVSHVVEDNFGMRDFAIDGKHFYLNGEKRYLRGSNISLQRFFEDPECADLVWNRKWVTRLLSDIPKKTNWNAVRLSLGPVPDFWYDIADSCGLLIQNEWNSWQQHGWESSYKTEFTNWIWSDGSHPSIVIWDALNESRNKYIGNTLIPELKLLDPTRPWDDGYMDEADMPNNEMDEPHPYQCGYELMYLEDVGAHLEKNPYDLGKLDSKNQSFVNSKAAQLINEYGWMWLWRDGSPAKLCKSHFDYFTGKDASPEKRREFQAYWLQLETEWLRAERSNAGVLSFCMLTNNYGFTGDYFTGPIKDLNPSPALNWFQHCFAPVAVFIDLADQRYFMHAKAYTPNTDLTFNLVGINDLNSKQAGTIEVKVYNNKGGSVVSKKLKLEIAAWGKTEMPLTLKLPKTSGGYLVVSELTLPETGRKMISRRYIRVGDAAEYSYFNWRLMNK